MKFQIMKGKHRIREVRFESYAFFLQFHKKYFTWNILLSYLYKIFTKLENLEGNTIQLENFTGNQKYIIDIDTFQYT